MANLDFGHGFRPIYDLVSGSDIPMKEFNVDASAATIYPGDLLKLETDGYVAPSAATNVNNIGVAACGHTTGTAGTVLVYYSPTTVFQGQVNAGTLDIACVGACGDLDASEGPDTVRGLSGHQVSATVANTAATFKIIALYPIQATYKAAANAFGANQIVEVLINEHLLKDSAGI